MAQMQSKREEGLFYLQDLLDDIAKADAEWFARLCLNGGRAPTIHSEVKNVQPQVQPPAPEQAA